MPLTILQICWIKTNNILNIKHVQHFNIFEKHFYRFINLNGASTALMQWLCFKISCLLFHVRGEDNRKSIGQLLSGNGTCTVQFQTHPSSSSSFSCFSCVYRVYVAQRKNVVFPLDSTLCKNFLLVPLSSVTFYEDPLPFITAVSSTKDPAE